VPLDHEGPTWLVARLRAAALLLLAAGICSFLVMGANRPANPILVPPQGIVKPAALRAFDAADFSVTPGPGLSPQPDPRCALVASTVAQQELGLMGQRSLGGFAGMIFEWSQPTTKQFYMKNTVLPLSIAWFDRSGRFVGSATMPPCPTSAQSCPLYGAPTPYQLAIEVHRGGLGALGIGPGSVLQLGGPCVG
jgi:uncharacterized membrane protein (UPF0127 family)